MDNVIFTAIPEDRLAAIMERSMESVLQKYATILDRYQNEPTFLTVEQAAEVIGLSVASVHRLTSKKLIPFSRKGRRLFFKRSELEAWLESGRVKTVNEIEAEADQWLASMAHK